MVMVFGWLRGMQDCVPYESYMELIDRQMLKNIFVRAHSNNPLACASTGL